MYLFTPRAKEKDRITYLHSFTMKKVLILGAGLVSRPIVRYLLDRGYAVTVASLIPEQAESLIEGHPGGIAVGWSIEDTTTLENLIAEHNLTVSLLPWMHHVTVAELCIKKGKHLVTTSYVKPAMQALNQAAHQAGIIILNELGLDPGIDHMSAMRIIDHIHGRGGNVDAFYSICGALPAPEAADNPFRYKFSWSPKGVVMAANNDGKFLRKGQVIHVPTEDLFKNPLLYKFPGVGELEIYPNRDSIPYIDLYGIPEVKTMMRGTFRYPGWCEILDAIKRLTLLSNESLDCTGKTYAEFMALMTGEADARDIRAKVAAKLGMDENLPVLKAMEWLGLFDDTPMGRGEDTPFSIISDSMIERMQLGVHERDMVAMLHVFEASYPDGKMEVIKSMMLDFGSPETDTAIARTVALPAAIGVEMILNGEITEKGVQIPVMPGIYAPILDRLESLNIKMVEHFGLPPTETIG